MQIKKKKSLFHVISLCSERKINLWWSRTWHHLVKGLYIYTHLLGKASSFIFIEVLLHKDILSPMTILQGEGKAKLLTSICAYFYVCVGTHNLYP